MSQPSLPKGAARAHEPMPDGHQSRPTKCRRALGTGCPQAVSATPSTVLIWHFARSSRRAAPPRSAPLLRSGALKECAVAGSGEVGSRKLGGNGDSTRPVCSAARSGSGARPRSARSSSSGPATTSGRMNDPAARTRTTACGMSSSSLSTAAAKSSSSPRRSCRETRGCCCCRKTCKSCRPVSSRCPGRC